MAHSNSTNDNPMQVIPLTSMTANAIKSLNKEELNAALSWTNTQASTSLTTDDIEAALILVNMNASSTDGPATHTHKLSNISIPRGGQTREIDSQRQKRRKYLTEHQHQQRVKRSKGDRKAEYRKYIAKETAAHREERLRKKREKAKAKRKNAKRAE